MEISVIASGSNGNCCLVEDKDSSVLVDAGKSCKEICARIDRLGGNLENVNAILLTHRHIDHTMSVGVISRRYNIPVYLTKDVLDEVLLDNAKVVSRKFKIGGLSIAPIKTSHDVPCVGFKINNFGVFTDTGVVTKEIIDVMKRLKGVLIESNHDIDMLINGRYPAFLKQRILSDKGHLSNIHASELIKAKGKNIDLVLLGHLSGNNNTIDVAKKTFESIVGNKEYHVCSRDKESGCWEI